ncbi:DNA-binding LacI/PurR family transcriptional regulator [Thermocatellispora tengchongensis]|uniref:DNA-binding LacI/PurR family transcriptional regulator n=1 Tax=Thermocatellispora tengchongensis TaxID=1073253 RepID=A0A840PHT3_9ACTN|nr:LacI family DNA-binding transcriptional regulator [Thermocatellispora tengchongensis]MBB5137100.1 DNA-binding LacI/PurR family transcriptional regulator [Thermocatellispora tengchongensis]
MIRRLTQQDIARMAGVSQTTVSLVLNNRADSEVRIAPETRERVLRVIRETGYVADPVARRLADRRNRILGVFTYEAVFPAASADFYHPFLVGIEECAEEAGCDLLLFTSGKAHGGRRRIFSEDSRVRLADGCVLLGRTIDRDDLARLIAERIPFVSVGRRDDAGGPVPYVGADYPPAVRELAERVVARGHRRLAYVGAGEGAESYADRMRGFREATAALGVEGVHLREPRLEDVLAAGVTAVFVEESADGVTLVQAARERGMSVPADLSVLALGALTRPVHIDIDFSGFRIPRREMGHRAVELLTQVLERGGTPQELLACEPVEGSTLAAPSGATR